MTRVYDPCTAAEAVARMLALAKICDGKYVYGAGNYIRGADRPYTTITTKSGLVKRGADCRIAFLHGWKVESHEPGYNRAAGPNATVVDDVNYNSLIEDGLAARELIDRTFRGNPVVEMPRLGDFLAYPTFYLPHHPDPWIGHGAGIVGIPDDYVPGEGWHRLTLAQCHGPEDFAPGFVLTDGSMFDQHDATWPLPQHRVVLLRPRERA